MDVVGKFEKAKKIMDECENSQLVLEKRKEHIKLAPKFLGNVRAGVHQQLTDKLLQRHQVLDGFPLAYTNVRALQQFGKIISDHTCIHFDIEADFIIFKPAVGQKLNAKVNKISKRHIGCLVHNHFNAWTPHMSSTEKLSADILMGAEIEISVQEVSTDRNVVSIRGKFERFLSPDIENSRVLLITPLSESDKRKRKKKDVDAAVEGTVIEQNTVIEDNDIATPKKKKKHQKEVAELSHDGLSDTLKHDKDYLSVNGTLEEESPRKSKKKHKKEKRKITEEDVSLVNGGLDIDDSIASLTSCEPLFTSTQVDDVNNNEGGKKKSKKHKKKHKVSNDTNDSEIDPNSLLQSDNLDPTTECSINESDVTDSKHEIESKHKKSRKRTHGQSNFTAIKEKVVKQDLDFAEPSPVKKLKKQKKVVEIDMDSSADFEDTSKSRKKEKKNKKHKNKE